MTWLLSVFLIISAPSGVRTVGPAVSYFPSKNECIEAGRAQEEKLRPQAPLLRAMWACEPAQKEEP